MQSDGFPSKQIEHILRLEPRNMQFTSEEVEAILEEKYGSGYTFSVLALLYPWIDYSNKIHQDHIHPKSLFTKPKLKARSNSFLVSVMMKSKLSKIRSIKFPICSYFKEQLTRKNLINPSKSGSMNNFLSKTSDDITI